MLTGSFLVLSGSELEEPPSKTTAGSPSADVHSSAPAFMSAVTGDTNLSGMPHAAGHAEPEDMTGVKIPIAAGMSVCLPIFVA